MNLLDPLNNNLDPNGTPIGCKSTEEIFDALELLIGDVNEFVEIFCERIQRIAPEHEDAHGHLRASDGLFDEQEDWDVKRAHVEQKIRRQVDLLEDAWLRLEAEQRSLLQMKEGLAVGLANRWEKYTCSISRGAVMPSVHEEPKSPPQTQRAAIREFEKLRQEIQAVRPQNTAK